MRYILPPRHSITNQRKLHIKNKTSEMNVRHIALCLNCIHSIPTMVSVNKKCCSHNEYCNRQTCLRLRQYNVPCSTLSNVFIVDVASTSAPNQLSATQVASRTGKQPVMTTPLLPTLTAAVTLERRIERFMDAWSTRLDIQVMGRRTTQSMQ